VSETTRDDTGEAPAIDPRLVALVREILLGSAVARRIGIELASLEADRAVLALPFSRENVTVGDIVHGGVIATLVDVAAVAAAISGVAADGFAGCATSTLTISYLAPAKGMMLRAEARTLRRGKRQVTADVSVGAETGLVAKALATISLF
jgi:uncharacterized protein (TIGR00369 family)